MKHITNEEFTKLSRFVYDTVGIRITNEKRSMLESRMMKRMRKLSCESFTDYIEYLFSREGIEKEHESFFNVITTNKTDFFREPRHFDFLKQHALPALYKTRNHVTLWSSACSRGAEPYTMAIVMEEYCRFHRIPPVTYGIVATDISTDVLQVALQGIYTIDEVAPVDDTLKKRYLLRGKKSCEGQVRIAPFLQTKIEFRHLNLMDNFLFRTPFDIIFCRNVTIYFDRETQKNLVLRLLHNLADDGYLFMGHSEVLDATRLPVKAVGSSVYQKH